LGSSSASGSAAGVHITSTPGKVDISISFDGRSAAATSSSSSSSSSSDSAVSSGNPDIENSDSSAAASSAANRDTEYTLADVAKHNTEKDCWVVVNGQVLNTTDFLKDHPGGKKAIMLFAGKDATEEFNMLHKRMLRAHQSTKPLNAHSNLLFSLSLTLS
jgi:cytochrome b involved in lipid metabolism